MAEGTVDRLPVTRAVADMLRVCTGRPIGIAEPPTLENDASIPAPFPYAIVYPLPGGEFTGSFFHHPDSEANFEYQVTSVAARQDQVEWMADRIRRCMIGRDLSGNLIHAMTVTGLLILSREPTGTSGVPVENGRVWSMAESFYVRVVTSV